MAMKTRTLATSVLALLLSSCAAEYSAVGIQAICAPPAPETNGSCIYPATCGATFAGTPLLDATTAALPFRLPFQFNNLLANNADPAAGRVNTNDAFIQSFEMTYAGAPLSPWNVSQAITVPAAGSSGGLVQLIPTSYFAGLIPAAGSQTSIVVSVRAHGILGSQDSFTTAWFQVPVTVCAGCLNLSVCTAPNVVASCPSTAPGSASPGQSANVTCIAPPAARE
jgi:hypothetical protein